MTDKDLVAWRNMAKKACPLPDMEYSVWAKKKGIPMPKAPTVLPPWKDFKAQYKDVYGLMESKYVWLNAKAQHGPLTAKQKSWMKANAQSFSKKKLPKIAGTAKKVKKTKSITPGFV